MKKISLPAKLALPSQLNKAEKFEICLLHFSGIKNERRENLSKKVMTYVAFYN